MAKDNKPRSPLYQGNNAGGYGNPPVDGQFKGKPGPGRPKGSVNGINAELSKMLTAKVARTDGGPSVPMSKAFALAARNTMLSGGVRGIELGLRLNALYGIHPPVDDEKKPDFSVLNEVELNLLSSFFSRAIGDPPEPPPEPASYFCEPPTSPVGPCIITLRPDGHLTINKVDPDDPLAKPPMLPG